MKKDRQTTDAKEMPHPYTKRKRQEDLIIAIGAGLILAGILIQALT